MQERLQKIIARAGLASRRRAEQLIASGQVTVNGAVVTEMGTKADVSRDHIKVSGKLIHGTQEHIYIALHKPAEVVATMSDPEGRRSVADFLPGVPARVYPVGRLEYHASGLLLLTNDGELANRLMRSHGLRQTYLVKVKGNLTDEDIAATSTAVRARIDRVNRGDNPWYQVTLAEASRDVLREKLLAIGHPVEKMKRTKIGMLELGDMPPGRFRVLTPAEIEGLQKLVTKTETRTAAAPEDAMAPIPPASAAASREIKRYAASHHPPQRAPQRTTRRTDRVPSFAAGNAARGQSGRTFFRKDSHGHDKADRNKAFRTLERPDEPFVPHEPSHLAARKNWPGSARPKGPKPASASHKFKRPPSGHASFKASSRASGNALGNTKGRRPPKFRGPQKSRGPRKPRGK
jgi:23S rRNA pseudouridine2605 synthase